MGLFNRKGTPAHSVQGLKDATGAPATHVDLVKDQGGVDMVKKSGAGRSSGSTTGSFWHTKHSQPGRPSPLRWSRC